MLVKTKPVFKYYNEVTPLFAVVFKENFEGVKFLVENGGDINRAAKVGYETLSPLAVAENYGNTKIMNYLKGAGAVSRSGYDYAAEGRDQAAADRAEAQRREAEARRREDAERIRQAGQNISDSLNNAGKQFQNDMNKLQEQLKK